MSENVPSVVRALACLETLSTATESLSLADLARILTAPKSSVLMLLRTLVDLGYIERDTHERYVINPALLGYGLGWIGGPQAVLVRSSWQILNELTASMRETSFLADISGDLDLRFLAKIVSPRDIRYDICMKRLSIPHKTASGRAIMAHWNGDQLRAYIAKWRQRSVPLADRCDAVRLTEQLADVRAAGISLVVDEWVAGATGISAPVFDKVGRPIAAITMGAVTARFMVDRDQIIASVKVASEKLSSSLPAGLRAM